MLGRSFETVLHNPLTLNHALSIAASAQDWAKVARVQSLLATTEGQYDYLAAPLNNMVDFAPVPFATWLGEAWKGQ